MHSMKPLTEVGSKEERRVAFRMSNEGLVTLVGRRRERHVYAIDLKRVSAVRHVPLLDHEVDSYDMVTLGYLSYLYTLRLANTKMMRRLTKVHKDVVTKTKDNIFMSGDIINYKIATLRCVIDELTPTNASAIEKHFKACGLTADDAVMYHLLYHNRDLKPFIDQMKLITDLKFTLDVHALRDEVHNNPKAMSEFKKQSSYFAHRKLDFISKGNRFDPGDMQQDLMERGVQAYYWVRPFYSVEHAVNYAKRSMHGYMNVLIAYYNSDDRRRVTNDDGFGHENVCRSYDDDVEGFVSAFGADEDAMIMYLDTKREIAA